MKIKQSKQTAALLLALVLLVSAFAGCTAQQHDQQQSAAEESGAEESGRPTVEEARQEQVITVGNQDFLFYRYSASQMMTAEALFLPVPREVTRTGLTEEVLRQLLDIPGAYGEYLDFTMEVEGSTVTFDFSGERTGSSAQEEPLFTLWATLIKNDTGVEKIRFLYEGRPFDAHYISLDSDGYVTETAFPLPEHSREELAELRALAPYVAPVVVTDENRLRYLVHDDATARKLANFIQAVTQWNIPAESFDTIHDAPDAFIVMASMRLSPSYNWYDSEFGDAYTIAGLAPLTETSGDYEGVMQEHVEQVARQLFGDAVKVNHTSPSPWRYMEYAGVYIPPHMGIYGYEMPMVLDYRDLGDRYEVEVAFITWAMGESFLDHFGNIITEAEALDYVQNRAPRHQITLLKDEAGGLRYGAHQLPEFSYAVNFMSYTLPTEQLHMDLLVAVRSYGNLPYVDDPYTSGPIEELVVDEDGVNFEIVPLYDGSALRLELLDWENGTTEVMEVLYETTVDQGFMLRLKAKESGAAQRLRLVVQYGGKQTAYYFFPGSEGEGVLVLGPREEQVW